MRIALVFLPSYSKEYPSLGIAYLSSHLIKAGHQVSRFEFNLRFRNQSWIDLFLDYNRDANILDNILNNSFSPSKSQKLNSYVEYCASTILESKPDLVAFSLVSDNRVLSSLVAKKIKEKHSVKIVFGGPDIFYRDDLSEKYLVRGIADYIINGEGERSLPDLLNKPKNYSEIPGLWYLDDNKLIKNNPQFEDDLDKLEFPLFLRNDIHLSDTFSGETKGFKVLPIMATRGCNGSCNFCAIRKLWKKFRKRSATNVIEEIEYQKQKHGIDHFLFNDCSLNNDYEFLKELCKRITHLKYKIYWSTFLRFDTHLDHNFFALLRSSGCQKVGFGAESGSNSVLKAMGKGTTTEEITKILAAAKSNKIYINLKFIIGYPTETLKDFKSTISFILENKRYINSFACNAFFLDPKADIYQKRRLYCVDEELICKRIAQLEKSVHPYFAATYRKRNYVHFENRRAANIQTASL